MGFSFGANSSKSNNSFSGTDNTTSNSAQNQSFNTKTSPDLPSWITDTATGLNGRLNTLGATDPYSYVPGATANQNSAYAGAGGLGANNGNFGDATHLTQMSGDTSLVNGVAGAGPAMVNPLLMTSMMPQVSAQSGSQNYSQYMNPYLNDVVGTTLNDFDVNAGKTRAQQALDLTGSGAFGGSGAAITQSMTEGELARARAAADANLRSQGFTTAMGYGMQDADRNLTAQTTNAGNELARQQGNVTAANAVGAGNADRQLADKTASGNLMLASLKQQGSAGAQLADIASGMDTNTRNNVATQLSTGEDQRKIQEEYAQAPLTMQDWLTQSFGGLPLSLFPGQTQTGTSDGFTNTTGTDTQSGTSNGKTSGMSFGFKTP